MKGYSIRVLYLINVCSLTTVPLSSSVQLKNNSELTPRPSRNHVKCGDDRYFDDATDRCEYCSPLCAFSRVRHAPDTCKIFCTKLNDFPTIQDTGQASPSVIPNCPQGRYYDEVTGRCDPCSPYCLHVRDHDAPKACHDFCRDEDLKQMSVSTITDGYHDGQNMVEDAEENTNTVSAIVIPICVGACVVAVVAAVLLYYRYKRQHLPQGKVVFEKITMLSIDNEEILQEKNPIKQEQTEQHDLRTKLTC